MPLPNLTPGDPTIRASEFNEAFELLAGLANVQSPTAESAASPAGVTVIPKPQRRIYGGRGITIGTARIMGYNGDVPPYWEFRGYIIPSVGADMSAPPEEEWLVLHTWRWPNYKCLRFCVPGVPFNVPIMSDVPVVKHPVWNEGQNKVEQLWRILLTFNGYCVEV